MSKDTPAEVVESFGRDVKRVKAEIGKTDVAIVPREDLAQRLSRQSLTVAESLLLLRLVAAALSEAHERSIIHRDLKPSNLFLRDGKVEGVTLLDFGVARRTGLDGITGTGVVIGTPHYMSPEQARGHRDLTPASDIFALGCVLYECLLGRAPFDGEHVGIVLMRILQEEPARLRSVLPFTPEVVQTVGVKKYDGMLVARVNT